MRPAVAGAEGDARALVQQQPHCRKTDAGRSAGHHRRPARKSEVHGSAFPCQTGGKPGSGRPCITVRMAGVGGPAVIHTSIFSGTSRGQTCGWCRASSICCTSAVNSMTKPEGETK